MRARVGLGILGASPGLVCGLRVWAAGLAPNPGPCVLGLLAYVVKARARPGPTRVAWSNGIISAFGVMGREIESRLLFYAARRTP
jgi:hypothetical protein